MDDEVVITYPEENNIIQINTRIYDGSNNYRENDGSFIINKYTIKFYKNSATGVGGSTSEYIEKCCISKGSESCNITSPTIEAPAGYCAVGWNTSKSATSASYSAGDSFTNSENKNITLYAVWENDNVRFQASNSKVIVYYMPSCTTGGICSYTQLNGFSNSGTINKSDLYTKSNASSVLRPKDYYMKESRVACYCSPSTSSTQKTSFPWCQNWMNGYNGDDDPNYISMWPSNVDGWYYSRTYDCFIESSKVLLKTDDASPPAVSECPLE